MKTIQNKAKKKSKKASFLSSLYRGYVHIRSTYNNTLITLTDTNGATLAWCSAGKCGFKGTRKSTPFAAQTVGEQIGQYCRAKQIRQVDVLLQGPGNGREAALRGISVRGVRIRLIRDLTCVPHNGCPAPLERTC